MDEEEGEGSAAENKVTVTDDTFMGGNPMAQKSTVRLIVFHICIALTYKQSSAQAAGQHNIEYIIAGNKTAFKLLIICR